MDRAYGKNSHKHLVWQKERENRTMFYERLFHPKLVNGSCLDAVGISVQEGATGLNTEAKKATYELEKYVHSATNIIIRIRPIPATFFKHASKRCYSIVI